MCGPGVGARRTPPAVRAPEVETPVQLVLPVRLTAAPSLDNFQGTANRELLARLRDIASEPQQGRLWLVGSAGSGKSHLLTAVLSAAQTMGRAIATVDVADSSADSLRSVAVAALVVVDGVDGIAGDAAWEASLLQLCNEQRGALVFASRRHPADAGFLLADLRSRLAGCEIYRLAGLTDADRTALLSMRATALGIELPEDVANYLLARLPRDAASLSAAIDSLDLASWRTQRRLTVPFVRAVLKDEA